MLFPALLQPSKHPVSADAPGFRSPSYLGVVAVLLCAPAFAADNVAPVTAPLVLKTQEDSAARGTVRASDADGDTVAYILIAEPAHGEATVDARTGAVVYTPARDFNGVDGFTVEITDGRLTASCAVSVAIASVNDAPVAAAATLDADEDTRFEGKPVVVDVDGDALTYRIAKLPKHGALEASTVTGAFSYMPAKNFHGVDAFAIEVSDGKRKALSAIAVVVAPVNDAPVTKALQLSTREDVVTKGAVVASDVDDAALSYSVKVAPSHGTASVDARTGAVSYVPAPDFNGADAFAIEVQDRAASSVISDVSVAIAAVPDIPRVEAVVLATAEDALVLASLPGSDPDGDRLTFRLLSSPRLGSAVLVDEATGAWRFAPGADLNGEDELAFDVSDGTTTVRGVVKIQVAPVNDAPTLANLELATLEDQGVEGQLVAFDIDGDPLTYAIAAAPGRGRSIVEAGQGGVRFEPARDQNGSASFTVTVSDGKATSAPAVVAVQIAAQNDAPVAMDAKLAASEDTSLVGAMGATDVDGDAVRFEIVRAPLHGKVAVTDVASGLFIYTPAPNYFGDDEFAFSATDASKAQSVGTIRLSVAPVDDVPVAAASGISAPFRGTVTGRLHGFDRESTSVTYRIVEQPTNGRVKLLNARTGDFEFSTDGTTSANTGFQFEVFDGALTSAPASLVVEIRSL